MEQYAILVLAAGSSERLGEPKQLLAVDGKSLLRHTVSVALSALDKVIVLLGYNAERIREEIKDMPVEILENKDWEEGMASSIRNGINFLISQGWAEKAVIIMAVDQPFVNANLLKEMIEKYESGTKPVVACQYKDTLGIPVVFDHSFYDLLLTLKGQAGAKKILNQNLSSVNTVPFPMGYMDIDTKDDYEVFKSMQSSK